MTRKLGVISDVHGNLPALQTALDYLEAAGADEVLCCGDVVGYGPWPNECAALVQARCCLCINGNHDGAVCGRVELTQFGGVARAALEWTQNELTPDTLAFLEACPTTASFADFFVTHASPRDPTWEYITDRGVAYQNFHHFEQRLGLFGHSHFPTLFVTDSDGVRGGRVSGKHALELHNRYLINPGSVGQPRDGDWRLCLALYERDGETEQLNFVRLEYDVSGTQKRIQSTGLPSYLATRLRLGN